MFCVPGLYDLIGEFSLFTELVHGIERFIGEILCNEIANCQHVAFVLHVGDAVKYLHLIACENGSFSSLMIGYDWFADHLRLFLWNSVVLAHVSFMCYDLTKAFILLLQFPAIMSIGRVFLGTDVTPYYCFSNSTSVVSFRIPPQRSSGVLMRMSQSMTNTAPLRDCITFSSCISLK